MLPLKTCIGPALTDFSASSCHARFRTHAYVMRVYHIARADLKSRRLDATLCGAAPTPLDTEAVWVVLEIRDRQRWTEPEAGAELCRRCLELVQRIRYGRPTATPATPRA